jgi:hypothetical protein
LPTLLFFDDLAADQPVRRNLRRIDRPRHADTRSLQDLANAAENRNGFCSRRLGRTGVGGRWGGQCAALEGW